MDPWFVLSSKPRKEFQLRDELSQKGLCVYLPVRPALNLVKPGPRRALFPGYLFARLTTPELSLDAIRWTPGLAGVVSFGGEPASVDEPIIDYIRQRLAQMELQARIPFRKGQLVKLPADHPLAELDAVFEEPMSDGKRALVLIKALGRLTRCEIDMSHLQPADAREWPPV